MNQYKAFAKYVLPSVLAFAPSGVYVIVDGFFVGCSIGTRDVCAGDYGGGLCVQYPPRLLIRIGPGPGDRGGRHCDDTRAADHDRGGPPLSRPAENARPWPAAELRADWRPISCGAASGRSSARPRVPGGWLPRCCRPFCNGEKTLFLPLHIRRAGPAAGPPGPLGAGRGLAERVGLPDTGRRPGADPEKARGQELTALPAQTERRVIPLRLYFFCHQRRFSPICTTSQKRQRTFGESCTSLW